MANTEKQLQKRRGQWLENFLNPKTEVYNDKNEGEKTILSYKSLAMDSLKIIGLTDKFDIDIGVADKFDFDNDPGLMVLKAIKDAPNNIQMEYEKPGHYFKKILDGTDSLNLGETVFEKLPFRIRHVLFGLGDYKKSKEKYMSDSILMMEDMVYGISSMRISLMKLFTILIDKEKPWDQAIFANSYDPDIVKLISSYGNLTNKASLNTEKGTLCFELKFLCGRSLFYLNLFPWSKVCSNIALDYIRNGGRYFESKGFLFCENCGNFKFINRLNKNKDKNRFCSNICRATANNEQCPQDN